MMAISNHERPLVRHVSLEDPLDILIDSRSQQGLVCLPREVD